ncbi:triple tyrosine motif-containing protein [Marinilabiliaceae bacterium ANBcel2]|nr:triple tyrosine motif-containing protein [Marinilabiliaceae bacterium ANBcel2]
MISFELYGSNTPFYGIPEVEYFSRRDYNGGTQNWSVSQMDNGLIYFANNDGVLEYDGTTWRFLDEFGNFVIRSVKAHDDTLYVGSYNEYGYYKLNKRNDYEYISLTDEVDHDNIGDIWNIFIIDDNVIFQSDKGLVLYRSDGSSTFISVSSNISNAFKCDNRVFVHIETKGIYELKNGVLEELKVLQDISESTITGIVNISNDEYVISTMSNGLYLWNNQEVQFWDIPLSYLLKDVNVFCVANHNNREIIFGTIQSGVVVSDNQGNIKSIINKDRGLENNTVLSLTVDDFGNIWGGLDNGIAKIDYASNISFIHGFYDIGAGYTMEIFKDNVYFGTNQGLYKIEEEDLQKPMKSRDDFIRIPYTEGQVWSLFIDKNNNLLCGHNSGVFVIDGISANLISPAEVNGAWIFRYPPERDDLLIVGTYNGLSLFENKNGEWIYKKEYEGFDESSRFMEWDEKGRLWITHGYRGLFRLTFSDDFKHIIEVESFEKGHRGLESNLGFNVTKVNDEVVFSSDNGVYGYNKKSDSFFRHSINEHFFQDQFPVLLRDDERGNVWYFTVDNVGVLRRLEDGRFSKVINPFLPVSGRLINGFEFVYVLDEFNSFIGVENGFAHYRVDENIDFHQEFNVHIRDFSNLYDESAVYYQSDDNQKEVPEWSYSQNSLQVRFSATCFNSDEILYSSYLDGFDDDWTTYSTTDVRQFTNLREGEYTFYVRAKNDLGVESSIVSFDFIIDPPWYRTLYAKIVYAIIIIFLLVGAWLILNWLMDRSKLVEKKRQRKKFQAKEEKLKVALEREKEMIRLRNDKLQNEMKFKEKELANSTMNIIQKNEFLLKIKDELQKSTNIYDQSKIIKKINSLITKIDKDIDNDSQWEVFELYLEQVHAEFLNRLKSRFPYLTSKELKLSAYLRMEMSSKEISSLMNISVRAVENNRYKLRKKLALDSKENLQEFIMNI